VLERCRVGVFEGLDVPVEDRTGFGTGWLSHVVCHQGEILEPGAGTLQCALYRGRRRTEHDSDLGGREVEHIAQDQNGPLPAGQVLHAGNERQTQVLSAGDDHSGVHRVTAHHGVRNWLKPTNLRSGRHRERISVGFRTAEA
jgi:hypothetical protein